MVDTRAPLARGERLPRGQLSNPGLRAGPSIGKRAGSAGLACIRQGTGRGASPRMHQTATRQTPTSSRPESRDPYAGHSTTRRVWPAFAGHDCRDFVTALSTPRSRAIELGYKSHMSGIIVRTLRTQGTRCSRTRSFGPRSTGSPPAPACRPPASPRRPASIRPRSTSPSASPRRAASAGRRPNPSPRRWPRPIPASTFSCS